MTGDSTGGSWRLSDAQLGVWRAEQRDPDCSFRVAEYLELHGPLDLAVFRLAVARATQEIDALNLRFAQSGDTPVQWVDRTTEIPLPVIDLTAEAAPAAAAEDWIAAEFTAEPQDGELQGGALVAQALLRTGPERHLWYLRCHHVAVDGYSFFLIFQRAAAWYRAIGANGEQPAALDPVTVLAEADREYAASSRIGRDRRYWLERMGDRPEVTGLSTRQAPRSARLRRRSTTLPVARAEELRRAAEAHGSSLPRLVIAALALYLGNLTDRREVVLGLPVTGRMSAGTLRVPGMTANAVPLRLDVDRGLPVRRLLRQVTEETARALRHQRYRFETLRADLGLTEGQPLYGPMVNIMQIDPSSLFDGLRTVSHNVSTGPVEDLSIAVYDRAAGQDIRIDLNANPGRYTDAELAGHERRLLRHLDLLATADPGRPIGTLDPLDPDERSRITVDWSGATVPPVPRATLPELFARQVRATPDAVALDTGEGTLTYAELDDRVNRLARLLIAEGAGPERVVALALPRSAELVVALLAVLTAGAAFLPVDPGYPAARIGFMLADSDPVLLLSTRSVAGDLPAQVPPVLLLEDLEPAAHAATEVTGADRPAPLRAGSAAYLIYTSGSTGEPKGVLVTHAGVAGLAAAQAAALPAGPGDRVLQFASPGFDAAFWELCLALLTGATLLLAPPDELLPGPALADLVTRRRPTHLTLPPSALAAMDPGTLDSVRTLVVAGEPCPAALAGTWSAGRRMINAYGPTEATVCATTSEPLDGTERPGIGGPVPGARVRLLDSGLRPVPAGVPGELYLAGDGLARGYHRRAGLSAARFPADPFGGPGERMYRTGDLARWRADGTLEFLDRTDDQVKVRGFRVELGEIESVLAAEPGVAAAVAVAHGEPGGDRWLAAYLRAEPGFRLDPGELAKHLATLLPAHLVPGSIQVLESFPLTPNGKLDRAALAAVREPVAGRAPRDQREEILCGLFAEVLGVPEVGIDDDFFALGGHSLAATRLIGRIRRAFTVDLPVAQLFDHPTVAGTSAWLDQGRAARPELTARPRPDRLPLSFAQRRLWFLDQLGDTGAAYHVPAATRLTGRLDLAALRHALADVVARHESLRTRFPAADGEPWQQILDPRPVELSVVDTGEPELPALIAAEVARPFDLAGGLPLRATLFGLGANEQVLLLVVHHIAGDGWSAAPLARDLALAYAARRAGNHPQWIPLPVQYADYTLWQRELLGAEDDPGSLAAGQLDYWRATLRDLPAELELSADRPRTGAGAPAGAELDFELDAELHTALLALARETEASLFMVVLAGLAGLLSRLGGGVDVPVGSPVAGRLDVAVDGVVGFFVNTVVVRADVSGDPGFGELVGRVRGVVLGALGNQDVPFERLVEVLAPVRSLGRHPLFQVMLSMRQDAGAELSLPGLSAAPYRVPPATAMFDLALVVTERPGGAGPALHLRVRRGPVRRGHRARAGRAAGQAAHRGRRRPGPATRRDRPAGPGRTAAAAGAPGPGPGHPDAAGPARRAGQCPAGRGGGALRRCLADLRRTRPGGRRAGPQADRARRRAGTVRRAGPGPNPGPAGGALGGAPLRRRLPADRPGPATRPDRRAARRRRSGLCHRHRPATDRPGTGAQPDAGP